MNDKWVNLKYLEGMNYINLSFKAETQGIIKIRDKN